MSCFSIKSFLVFLTVILLTSCSNEIKKKERVLPYIGDFDIEYKLVNGKEVADTIYPTIPFFYFYNQDSVLVKSTDLEGKIWIADFFFTTCSSICPGMTQNMKKLNENTRDLKDHVQFISFSINPEYDKPHILKKYMKIHEIEASNWVFLTGDELETHRLGVENFHIHASQDDSTNDGYAHSEAFALVDKEGHVRGVYNVADPKQIDQLEADLRKLIKYEYTTGGSD